MGQDKLSHILYNIATFEYDILGLIHVETDSFEVLHNKTNILITNTYTTYQTIYESIYNHIVNDTQKKLYQKTFSPQNLKKAAYEHQTEPVTIYIQFVVGKEQHIEWFAITRYHLASVSDDDTTFMYQARPASREKEINLEKDALYTVLNNNFDFLMTGSTETNHIKYFHNSIKNSPLSQITASTYTGFIDEMLCHVHPDDMEEFYNQVNPDNVYEQLHQGQYISLYINYSHHGKYLWYHIAIYPFHTYLDTNTHFIFMVYDATAQKEKDLRHSNELHWALERAEEANSIQNEFISNISHEIRTPLNGIQAVASLLLQEKTLTPSAIKKYAKIIQESGEQLLHVVNSTLDFSNLSSESFVYTEDEYNIVHLLKRLQKFVDTKKKKTVAFSLHAAELLPATLYGDEPHLEQAIINVIDNAFQYTSSGTVLVEINWESEFSGEGILHIDVSDTGIGISPEDAQNIFQTFRQTERKEHRKHCGIGMGLPITKLIIEHMGGSITFESKPGVGTTFHIAVPQTVLDDQPFGTLLENENVLYSADDDFIQGKHFLVVDDSRMNLEVMQVVLEEWGATLTLCESAREAIALLEAGKQYGIIFIDHFMPDINGIEATHIIRNMDSLYCQNVPIIAFTSNIVSNAKRMYQNEGMNDLLAKPLDIRKLKRLLQKWL